MREGFLPDLGDDFFGDLVGDFLGDDAEALLLMGGDAADLEASEALLLVGEDAADSEVSEALLLVGDAGGELAAELAADFTSAVLAEGFASTSSTNALVLSSLSLSESFLPFSLSESLSFLLASCLTLLASSVVSEASSSVEALLASSVVSDASSFVEALLTSSSSGSDASSFVEALLASSSTGSDASFSLLVSSLAPEALLSAPSCSLSDLLDLLEEELLLPEALDDLDPSSLELLDEEEEDEEPSSVPGKALESPSVVTISLSLSSVSSFTCAEELLELLELLEAPEVSLSLSLSLLLEEDDDEEEEDEDESSSELSALRTLISSSKSS
jgi:hypothetical protein